MESGYLLEVVMANTDAHVYVKDANFRFVYVNAALAHTLQTTQEALIGKIDADFVDEGSALPFRKADIEVLESEKSISLETTIQVKGHRLSFEDRKFPITLPDGSRGVAGIAFLTEE